MTDAPKNILQLDLQSYYRVGVNPPILQDIQWTIGSGEHWLLMGSNGAGKSSLLEILAGDIWPSRGSVRVLGHLYGECDKRVLKRRMGVVSPAISASIPGHELGMDIASSGAEARLGSFGPPKTADRARGCAALARVNAEHCSEKRFQIMSQGERQRVMIARALMHEPALIILDEPCVGLDPVARESFLNDLRQLASGPQAPTQVYVTHHPEEIPEYITHALLLGRGKQIAQGPIEQVLNSEQMSATFGAGCEIERLQGRYRLRVLESDPSRQ